MQETSTADLMGLPLPPLFKGEIKPISLSGFIEKRSGKVDMQFDAEIVPSVTTLMQGTPLKLFMNLTTETSWGATRRWDLNRRLNDLVCLKLSCLSSRQNKSLFKHKQLH